jgi:hypothetical protein
MRQRFWSNRVAFSLILFAAIIFFGGFLFLVPSVYASSEPLASTPLFTDSNLVSYYQMNGTSTDSKGSDNGIDTSVSYATSSGEFGEGGRYNGSTSHTDFGSVPIDTTGNWTISAWINPQTLSTGPAMAVSVGKDNGSVGNGVAFGIGNGAGGGSGSELTVLFSGIIFEGSGYTFPSANTWYLVTLTRSASTTSLYVNGSLITTYSVTPLAATEFHIGSQTGRRFWDGYVDDVAVFNRALSATEVSNLYTGDWSDSPEPTELYSTPLFTDPRLTSYYRMEGNSNDSKGSDNGIDTSVSYATSSGKFGEGASYNGSTSHTDFGSVPIDTTGNWTISAWINPLSLSTGPAMAVSVGKDNGSVGDGVAFGIGNGAGGGSGSELTVLFSGVIFDSTGYVFPSANTWYLVTLTRNASTTYVYVNGSQVATLSAVPLAATEFHIGSQTGIRFWDGYVDDVATFNRALTATEVADLYIGNWPASYPAALHQFGSDATTTISADSTTTDNIVIFGATVETTSTDPFKLEVEVTSSLDTFSGTPNTPSSGEVYSGQEATATLNLPPESSSDGDYHWQARLIDASTSATTSWQSFRPDATSTDFAINTVPLYTQNASPYPDATDSAVWASSTYDNAYPGSQCGTGSESSTIAACGCAITSVSMWLRYFGITTNNSGTDVNPETLNDWLEANGGYDNSIPGDAGILIWSAVDGYASPPGGGTISYDSSRSVNGGSSLDTLSSTIDDLLSSSTPDPVILVEQHAPDGSTTTLHYVVAMASSTYNGTSTYAVRDSYWYNTQYLNQPTSTGPGTVNFYNNEVDGIEIYYDPPQIPIWGQYDINAPEALMLVDSQGRRTGENPITGVFYREIPNTAYSIGASASGHPVGELTFSDLSSGQYTLYVLGGATGAYGVGIGNNDGQQSFQGNIRAGSMVAYVQNYNPADLASSTFVASGTVSSTASITTAPPDNWTPPAM